MIIESLCKRKPNPQIIKLANNAELLLKASLPYNANEFLKNKLFEFFISNAKSIYPNQKIFKRDYIDSVITKFKQLVCEYKSYIDDTDNINITTSDKCLRYHMESNLENLLKNGIINTIFIAVNDKAYDIYIKSKANSGYLSYIENEVENVRKDYLYKLGFLTNAEIIDKDRRQKTIHQ